jgi:5'-nucleotidase
VVASPSPAAVSTAVKPSLVPSTASPVPGGATAVATKPAATGGETHTVVSGDTLLTIAEKYYGDATLWRRIYDANTDVIGPNPDALQIDMQLRIPPKE